MSTILRRIFIYGVCLIATALMSAVITYEIMGPVSSGPSYSINDLQPLEDALHNYYLEVFTDGNPVYPNILQDLVTKKYITQDHLDLITSAYVIKYYHPPEQAEDPVLFRAQHRTPIITYSVSGHMRMKDPEAAGTKLVLPDVTVESDLP